MASKKSFQSIIPLRFQASKFNGLIVSSFIFRAMILDVGGRRHKVLESNFNIYPNTRLGKLLTAKTESEILNLCDGYKPGDQTWTNP